MTSDSKYSKVSSWTFYRAKNKARHIIDGTYCIFLINQVKKKKNYQDSTRVLNSNSVKWVPTAESKKWNFEY